MSKEFGGLGIGDLRAHNRALICKLGTMLLQGSDLTCYNWFKDAYASIFNPGRHRLDTTMWQNLKSIIRVVMNATRCRLGSG
uniref:Uncharacterized protein n=1 Tax=Triticum urartu TaxID=4572 RepID=A0A8R7Q5W0_TRIUA